VTVTGAVSGAECGIRNGLRSLNVLLHGNPDAAGPVVGNLYKAAEAVQGKQAVNNIVDPFACALEPTVATAATYALGVVDPAEAAEALAYREAVSGAEQLALAQARRGSVIAAQDAASAADRDAANQIQQQGDFFSGQYRQQAQQQQMQSDEPPQTRSGQFIMSPEAVHSKYLAPPAGSVSPLANPGQIDWVDENASMPLTARSYQDSAPGARYNTRTRLPQAPQIYWIDNNGGVRAVRFDGEDGSMNGSPVLVDRKTSVFPNADKENDALRQSEALSQNGLTGRWEVPNQYEAQRARSLFNRLHITNITVRVVPQ